MFTWSCSFTVFLKNRNIISKIRRSKVTDYAALRVSCSPFFGGCKQVRLKQACSATGANYNFEIWHAASVAFILSRERIAKVLIRLHGCEGWSAHLLFTYNKICLFVFCYKTHIITALSKIRFGFFFAIFLGWVSLLLFSYSCEKICCRFSL